MITKSDLLPYVPFDLESVHSQIASLNPTGNVLVTSSLKDEGVDEWIGLLRTRLEAKRQSLG